MSIENFEENLVKRNGDPYWLAYEMRFEIIIPIPNGLNPKDSILS